MKTKSFSTVILCIMGFLAASFCAGAAPLDTDSLQVRYRTFTSWCSPEKLFVHLDRTYYAAGETIWFKGYLSNASSGSLFPTSNFIYAELLNDKGDAVSRVKIKKSGDGFPGNILVRDELKSGNYTFRAYTVWHLNFPPEYMFTQKIRILGAEGERQIKALSADTLDVAFFPESGRYFDAVRANIAFKVTDSHGRSIETLGYIEDENGTTIVPIATLHDGMGVFSIVPEAGRKYFLTLSDGRKFELPERSTGGAMIGVRESDDGFNIRVMVRPDVKGGLLLSRDASSILPLAKIPSDGRSHLISLKKDFFNPGINHIIAVDESGKILAERLFYFYGSGNELPECSVKAALPSSPRGLIRTSISVKGQNGVPTGAELSMSVVRGSFSQYVQDDNLVSYLGLSSELKGRINNPAYYFDRNIPLRERSSYMDLLMMVQGWRYYDLEKIIDPTSGSLSIRHLKEYAQSIKGRIERWSGTKMPEKFIFSVIVPKLHFQKFLSVEKASRFTLDSLDFEEDTPFLISVNRKGLGADYIPKWSGDNFAPSYRYAWAPGRAAAATIEQKIPLFSEVTNLDTLEAAVVTAGPAEIFGSSLDSKMVSGDDFKFYANNTLIEYLVRTNPMLEYDGEFMFNRSRGGYSSASAPDFPDEDGEVPSSGMPETSDGGRGKVKLVEDGTEIPWWTYEQTYMEDIEALSVSTLADSYYNADGGVVMIKILPGGKRNSGTHESLLYFIPLGYQKPSRFYSPRYDLGDPHDTFDHRNTIFWSPYVKVENGSAEVLFCDTDQQDVPYIVSLQGFSSDGRPISFLTRIGE